jgi:hypothetical protein
LRNARTQDARPRRRQPQASFWPRQQPSRAKSNTLLIRSRAARNARARFGPKFIDATDGRRHIAFLIDSEHHQRPKSENWMRWTCSSTLTLQKLWDGLTQRPPRNLSSGIGSCQRRINRLMETRLRSPSSEKLTGFGNRLGPSNREESRVASQQSDCGHFE